MVNLAITKCQKHAKGKESEDPLMGELQDMKDELQVNEQLRLSSYRDPMSVLPLEMVLDIVELAAEMSNDYGLVARLSHVNTLWRRTMLSLPQLWRRCAVKFDGSGRAFKKMDTYYRRANQTPLRHFRMHLLKFEEYLSFYDNPLPSIDINAKVQLSSMEIVYTDHFKVNPLYKPVYTVMGNNMFNKVDKFACIDGGSLADHNLRDIDEAFVVDRVAKVIELEGFRYHAKESVTPGSIPRNQTLQRFKISQSRAPPIPHLMTVLPNLKSFEWDKGFELHEQVDLQLTDINLSSLESLLINDVKVGLDGIRTVIPISKFSFPNLKRCVLKRVPLYMLECIQNSPKITHLTINTSLDTDFSLMANASDPSVYIDSFLSAFDNLNELQVLDLTGTGYGVIVLHTIIKKKLCPKLRAVNVSKTAGSFGRLLIELVKQRNSTAEFTSIDELIVNRCPELEHEAVAWARKHVTTVQCIYESKDESKKQPRQRYRYERV